MFLLDPSGAGGGKAGGGKAGGGKAGGGKAGGGKAGGGKAGGGKAGGGKAGGGKAGGGRGGQGQSSSQHAGAPVSGRITSPYGPRTDPKTGSKGKPHHGIDIAAQIGTPVNATGAGTVTRAGWEDAKNHGKGYGQRVTINHGNGNISTYGHLSSISVKSGTKVKAGQVIGKSGNTGKSTGPHLHYEERHNGKPHNPTFRPDKYR